MYYMKYMGGIACYDMKIFYIYTNIYLRLKHVIRLDLSLYGCL